MTPHPETCAENPGGLLNIQEANWKAAFVEPRLAFSVSPVMHYSSTVIVWQPDAQDCFGMNLIVCPLLSYRRPGLQLAQNKMRIRRTGTCQADCARVLIDLSAQMIWQLFASTTQPRFDPLSKSEPLEGKNAANPNFSIKGARSLRLSSLPCP